MVCITEEERIGETEIFTYIGHYEGTKEEMEKEREEARKIMAKHLVEWHGISFEEAMEIVKNCEDKE